jgi:hypothetical protein
MLNAEREAARTLLSAPWLVAGGLVVAVAWLVTQALAAVPVMLVVLPRDTQVLYVLPLANVVSVVVLPPALAGLYAAVRASRDRDTDGRLGLGETLRLCGEGYRRHAVALTQATIVYRLGALALAAVALVVLLAGDTVLNYGQYALGAAGHQDGIEELAWVWVLVMVAGGAGRLVLVFYDLPVLFGGVAPRHCWRAAVRFARRRPGTLVRYGVSRFMLWSPMVVVLLLQYRVVSGRGTPVEAAMSLGSFLVAAPVVVAVTATIVGTYHVVVYQREVAPVLSEPTPTGTRSDVGPESPLVASPDGHEEPDRADTVFGRRRLAVRGLVALLLVTAAGATVAVRISDTRPMPDAGSRPVSDDASAETVVTTANQVLHAESRREHRTIHRVDVASGKQRHVWDATVAIDRADRRARLDTSFRDPDAPGGWANESIYGGETTAALTADPNGRIPSDPLTGDGGLVVRRTDGWTVYSVPGYRTMLYRVIGTGAVDPDGQAYRVLERTDGRIVLVATRTHDEEPSDDGRILLERRSRLVVDAATGQPRRLVVDETFQSYENGSATERYRMVERRQFTDYGDVTVDRPEPVDRRGPVEWLWDLVYY